MDLKIQEIKELFQYNLPLLSALGDRHRQQILLIMADECRLSVGEITRLTKLSRPAVSHHIRILKKAGLLSEERQGVKHYYRPQFQSHIQPMKQLIEAIDKISCQFNDTEGNNK